MDFAIDNRANDQVRFWRGERPQESAYFGIACPADYSSIW